MLPTNTQTDTVPAPPCIMVIFGGAGDLAKRKLFPALFYLSAANQLPENFAVLGVSREDYSSDDYRELLNTESRAHLDGDYSQDVWDRLIKCCHYLQGDFRDPAAYQALAQKLGELDDQCQTPGNYLFYMATPPAFFGDIAQQIAATGLATEPEGHWRRLVIEKPFGHDLQSARDLNLKLLKVFDERQLYRIDHYLGKETVQNFLAFRFANGVIEPIWNRRYIDHVQITVAEPLGVENRASYYEGAGALRDMIPNHLLAVLTIIAMEPPISFDANEIRNEQAKVLRAIQPMTPEEVLTHTVRGQYDTGVMADGERVSAYRQEPGVDVDSHTETFVALSLMIDSWRWAGVPFYLRTGKRMPGRFTEIMIQYKHAPNAAFKRSILKDKHVEPNVMVLRIQPSEGISLGINAKVPGQALQLSPVEMDFSYDDYFGNEPSTGYETLIYDCMQGDPTLFKRADIIETAWQLMEPILDVWSALPPRDFPNYAAGEWGPSAADELLQRDGRSWRVCTSGGCARKK
ncbi:MAG TPA: glucose-6-phosphate dehydrogenase [Gammaproteobacteria bacterium]|nr:glucose-6-phosphate dehydrogenase [Gammaproteobacteria bacterium]